MRLCQKKNRVGMLCSSALAMHYSGRSYSTVAFCLLAIELRLPDILASVDKTQALVDDPGSLKLAFVSDVWVGSTFCLIKDCFATISLGVALNQRCHGG